jgi:cytochrome b involved in lipid metabolism
LVLLGEAGNDATKAWQDVEHSAEAKRLMEDYLVGYCTEVNPKMLCSLFGATDVVPSCSFSQVSDEPSTVGQTAIRERSGAFVRR